MPLTLTGESRLFPLIGDPIHHARSPSWLSDRLASRGLNTVCLPMAVPEGALDPVMAGLSAILNVDGVCITMPHKIAATAYCKTLSETSQLLGVVSALRRNADGSWHGHSTDGDAFVKALRDNGAQLPGTRALLLGAGGAGSAIAIALLAAGIGELGIYDPNEARQKRLLTSLAPLSDARLHKAQPDPRGYDLLCQATPLGLQTEDPLPVDPAHLTGELFVGDVVAGGSETPLMRIAREKGCGTSDGDAMVRAVLDIMSDFLSEAWR